MEEGKKLILIVEDEKALLDSYAEVFEANGYATLKAIDGYEGMKLLIKHVGKIDLVLLDLMMPGLDGLEVLRTMKGDVEKYGDMPVVVLTAMVSDKVIKEAYDSGAYSYLIKSELNSSDLLNEVKRVLGN